MKALPLRIDALSTTWNKTGFRGVEEIRPGRFRATLGDHAWRSRYFSTAKQAARAYDREARRRYGKLAFLNFPKRGEQRVRPADPDLCRHGHDRRSNAYFRPDDGRFQCRLCNALARARAAARRKSRR